MTIIALVVGFLFGFALQELLRRLRSIDFPSGKRRKP